MKKILLVTIFLAVNSIYAQSTSIPSAAGGGSSYYQTVQDEGSSVTQRATLNFAGSGVTCADATTKTTCTISGGGAAAVTDLTDCKVTVASVTATIAACRYEYTASDGRNTTAAISSATWAISGGTDTGTARFEIDPNGGSPIIRCIYSSGMTATNYTATGCTETSGEDFSVGTKQLATLAVATGAWTTLTDVRSMLATHTVAAGNGISKSGNVIAVNTGYSFPWGAAQSSDSTYNFCADAGANDTYACTISPAITAYATGAHYFFKANTVNTGAATINLNSLGAKTIKKYTGTGGADLADADIRAGAIVHVVYDGTNMQLQTGLGNAGGGTPGGSTTEVQFNNTGAFDGDAGFTWDDTNKILYVTRSNSGAVGGRMRAYNSASLSLNQHAIVEACVEYTNYCAQLLHGYMNNYDGTGSNYYWSQIRNLVGSDYYQVIGRRATTDPVHIGGDINTSNGWMAVVDGGVSRFADADTAGRGLVSIQGAPTELTGQTGNVAAQTLLASSHTAGMYRVCGFVAITTAGTGTLAAWTLAWRSPASGTDLTHDIFWSGELAETATPVATAADEFNVCKVIRSTGTSAISLDPGNTDATYTTAWTVERLR